MLGIDAVHSGGFDKDVDGGGLAALLAFDGVLSTRSGHAHQGLRPVIQAGQKPVPVTIFSIDRTISMVHKNKVRTMSSDGLFLIDPPNLALRFWPQGFF